MIGSCYCDADNDRRLSTDTSAAAAAATTAGGGGGAGATGKLRSSVAQVCQTMPGLGVSDNDATDNRPSRRRHGYDDQNKTGISTPLPTTDPLQRLDSKPPPDPLRISACATVQQTHRAIGPGGRNARWPRSPLMLLPVCYLEHMPECLH